MLTQRQVGWSAAAVSLLSTLFAMVWPEPKTLNELLGAEWMYGVLALLAVSGSIVAGRLLSPRWYYLAMLWVFGAATIVLVIGLGGW